MSLSFKPHNPIQKEKRIMKLNKRNVSTVFLILGMVCLVVGLSTDYKIFSWAAIAFVFISLVLGGRWMRPRRR
jgi:hypothetical protein